MELTGNTITPQNTNQGQTGVNPPEQPTLTGNTASTAGKTYTEDDIKRIVEEEVKNRATGYYDSYVYAAEVVKTQAGEDHVINALLKLFGRHGVEDTVAMIKQALVEAKLPNVPQQYT